MKNFGCIVPVSLIIAIGLLLAGCATQFGTYTDKSKPRAYLNKHHPFHTKVDRTSPATVAEDVPYWKCNGTLATNDARCAEAYPSSTVPVAPQVAPEKPKKKMGFWKRVRSHLPFRKKDQ